MIQDNTNNNNKTFEGYYTLLVKGSGKTASEIVEFSETDLLTYNPGINDSDSSLIWTASVKDYPFPVFTSQNTSISWKCERNSPCGRIMPTIGNPSPYVYLLLEASTEHVNYARSYCKLNDRFVVRLYGLPANFDYAVIMTVSTFGLCLFILSIYIYTKLRVISKHESEASNLQSKAKSKSVSELPKSKSMKSALYSSASSVLEEAKSILEKAEEESEHSSEEMDQFDEKDKLVQDSVLTSLVENNRLRHRGRSVLG